MGVSPDYLHHIAELDRDHYATEVDRVLKPGGYLLLRGSAESREESFHAVDQVAIDRFFDPAGFQVGRVWPIVLANNSGKLTGNMVAIRKRD